MTMQYIIYCFIATIVSSLLFKNYKKITKNYRLIDHKNKNYAHNPTPTGSGIIFLSVFLIGNLFFFYFDDLFYATLPNRYYVFILSITILTVISFKDDIKTIDPIIRLIFQISFVYLSITSLKLNTIDLPDKFLFLATVFIWIYIINITNFIDGSDGLLIITFIFYCFTIIFLTSVFNINIFSKYIALICLPFAITFLFFNAPPAKIFMGDAGSIFLGFICGFFFLELLIENKWYLAISLMSYKLVDCTYCLLRKLKRGIMPWVGLYDYFFLVPTLKNKSNHLNVLILMIIFFIINFIIIFLQEYLGLKLFFLISIIFAILLCYIFNNLENRFAYLKFKK